MKTQTKNLITCFCLLLLSINTFSQSCVITRLPSSGDFSNSGNTNSFSIIYQKNCTPTIIKSNDSWFSYTVTTNNSRPSYNEILLYVTTSPNYGNPRTGYIYVNNNESFKITINQAAGANVNVPVSGVSVNPTSAFLSINETVSLYPTVLPMQATNKNIIWNTSNPNIATIAYSSNYVTSIKGISPGKVQITATTEDGGHIAASNITVTGEAKSFSWKNYTDMDGTIKDFTTPAKDQITQGPCFLFAAIGMVEAKYKIQNSTTNNIDLSEASLHPNCTGLYESIYNSLTYIKNNGVLEESCYPYSLSAYAYGSLPYPNCQTGICTGTTKKYKVASFSQINFSNLDPNLRSDYLKSIIRQNGTVAVSFSGSSLHNGASHAYEIYGWNGLYWLLKDSWPNEVNSALSTDIDIPEILAANSTGQFAAYYINGNVNISNKIGMVKGRQNSVSSDQDDINFEIVPNPANNQIRILNFPKEGALVQISTTDGRLVFNNWIKYNVIDITQLPKGSYLMKFNSNDKQNILKFIKQ
ncbi:C1 family peptidase [Epilithonimonas zeae]|uniref:C1 family peptidase n=1 Tax=Epilithonimonas zeae TaxID=1416779 RepID=UPI00200EC46A|nr:C1 family peptidase [Epilithonimonas zeae]UQB68706.1 Ig-like domain-containing protein [Epilithonimonas zeae]